MLRAPMAVQVATRLAPQTRCCLAPARSAAMNSQTRQQLQQRGWEASTNLQSYSVGQHVEI